MSLKKKRGSSLILVLLIFAVLSISGISILSLTVSDYNARITASKKTQSLYAADSGVNVVYGIMKKIISQGIQKGNEASDTYMTAFSQSSSSGVNPLLGLYKDLYSEDGSLDTNKLKIKLNDIFQLAYKDYVLGYITSPENYLENGKYTDLNNNVVSLYDTSELAKLPTITLTGKGSGFIGTPNQWKINITSKFSTNPTNGQTSNKKTVQADIVLSVPDYNDSYFVETKNQEIALNPVWKNVISVDGDMNINSNLTVDGKVFVVGKTPLVTDEKVYTKYNGGISIGADGNNSITANFNDNVVTSNSFNISGQNKTVNVTGNIYAGNVYIGNTSSAVETESSNCKLTVSDSSHNKGIVYTDNDLALYATNSHIDIDKYYGINDLNEKRAVDEDYNSSSSIIVNTDDIGTNSYINIGDAIINGTAYVNTATSYQTGESVSIKGNYAAYTMPIPKDTKTPYDEDIVEFVYNDPLQLVNNFKISDAHPTGDNLTGIEKSEYFKAIDGLFPTILKKDGINITNLIFSAGISTSNGKIINTFSENMPTAEAKITEAKNDFAKYVYEMDDINDVGVPKVSDESKMLTDDYQMGKVNKNVFNGDWVASRDASGYQINKLAQVTLNNVTDIKDIDINNSEVEVRTKSKNVVLIGTNSTYTPNADDEIVDLRGMTDTHGIIITTKDVILSGEVKFTGTIIAGGNLTIRNDGAKILKEDENYVLKTIARNYTDVYSKVFNALPNMNKQVVEVAATVGKNENESSIAIDGGLVKLNNWRVNK